MMNFKNLPLIRRFFGKKNGAHHSWRDIDQNFPFTSVQHTLKHPRGKIRYILLGVCVIALGVGYYVYSGSRGTVTGESRGGEYLLENINFKTNGVLTRAWLNKHVPISMNQKLMAVDIFEIKRQLEGYGQIRKATVERMFPSTLKITVEERHPVLKLFVAEKKSKKKLRLMLVSSEGDVYSGYEYSRGALKRLPLLTDVRLTMNAGHIMPIKDFAPIYVLLQKIRRLYPNIFSQWKQISLKKYLRGGDVPGSIITVKTKSWGEILFLPHEYEMQLDRLSYILNYAETQQIKFISTIDLTLGEQALAEVGYSSRSEQLTPFITLHF
jgi:hypothetical protein